MWGLGPTSRVVFNQKDIFWRCLLVFVLLVKVYKGIVGWHMDKGWTNFKGMLCLLVMNSLLCHVVSHIVLVLLMGRSSELVNKRTLLVDGFCDKD